MLFDFDECNQFQRFITCNNFSEQVPLELSIRLKICKWMIKIWSTRFILEQSMILFIPELVVKVGALKFGIGLLSRPFACEAHLRKRPLSWNFLCWIKWFKPMKSLNTISAHLCFEASERKDYERRVYSWNCKIPMQICQMFYCMIILNLHSAGPVENLSKKDEKLSY